MISAWVHWYVMHKCPCTSLWELLCNRENMCEKAEFATIVLFRTEDKIISFLATNEYIYIILVKINLQEIVQVL